MSIQTSKAKPVQHLSAPMAVHSLLIPVTYLLFPVSGRSCTPWQQSPGCALMAQQCCEVGGRWQSWLV